ncbi:MAG TPA: efflux RND transporter periplasmic adaptor subunit, partial [Thermodesulfobacteriota bacterium]
MVPTDPGSAREEPPRASADELAREVDRLRIDRAPAGRRRVRRLGRLWLPAVLLCAVGAALLYPRLATVTVEAAPVERVDPVEAAEVLTAGGYVVARNKVDVSSQMTGRIEALLVEEGQRVEQGAVLARLDAGDLRAQLAQAEAAVEAARARLAELTAGSRPQEIAAARAEVAEARARVTNAEGDLARMRRLHEARIVARRELEQAERDALVARARLRAARERAALVEIGPRPEQVARARAEVAQARANAAYTAALLDKTVIRAPMSGTVVEKLVEVGETVTTAFIGERGAKSALVSMADLNDLQVEADVNEADIRKLAMGQPAMVVPDAYPDRSYPAELEEIAPRADRQKATIRVKVEILEPDALLRPEMSAKVVFLEAALPEGARARVLAPRAAVTERNGRTGVFVVGDGGTAAFVPITVAAGAEEGDRVEAASGLVGGERVVVAPPDRLQSGGAVAV